MRNWLLSLKSIHTVCANPSAAVLQICMKIISFGSMLVHDLIPYQTLLTQQYFPLVAQVQLLAQCCNLGN